MTDESGAIDLSKIESLASDGDPVSREHLAALLEGYKQEQEEAANPTLTELKVACAGGLRIVTIPATFELKDGRVFLAEDFRAWGWTPFGVLAIGRFDTEAEDVPDVYQQFNGDQIGGIKLEYAAFIEACETDTEGDESEVTDAEVVEEDTSGDDAAESSSD